MHTEGQNPSEGIAPLVSAPRTSGNLLSASLNHTIEERVTPWIVVAGRPEWAGSDVTQYRIWQRVSQWGWEQRHEWKTRDGYGFCDAWIKGAQGWTKGAEPALAQTQPA